MCRVTALSSPSWSFWSDFLCTSSRRREQKNMFLDFRTEQKRRLIFQSFVVTLKVFFSKIQTKSVDCEFHVVSLHVASICFLQLSWRCGYCVCLKIKKPVKSLKFLILIIRIIFYNKHTFLEHLLYSTCNIMWVYYQVRLRIPRRKQGWPLDLKRNVHCTALYCKSNKTLCLSDHGHYYCDRKGIRPATWIVVTQRLLFIRVKKFSR